MKRRTPVSRIENGGVLAQRELWTSDNNPPTPPPPPPAAAAAARPSGRGHR